jgi:hypothetical protein
VRRPALETRAVEANFACLGREQTADGVISPLTLMKCVGNILPDLTPWDLPSDIMNSAATASVPVARSSAATLVRSSFFIVTGKAERLIAIVYRFRNSALLFRHHGP